MTINMLTEVRRRMHKHSRKFSIEKISGITELENTISELKSSTEEFSDTLLKRKNGSKRGQ